MSEYPSDWRVLPLGDVAEVVGGGTPSRDAPAFWGNDHYWITPSEVVAKDGQAIERSKERISDLGLHSSGAKLHPPGTILMTSRASIGFAAIAKEEISTNQGFQSLRCGNELDNWFALHQIRHRRAELHQLAAGSTFLEVSGSNVRSFPFIVPPLPEQKKIAEILSGIDKIIHKQKIKIQQSRNLLVSLLDEKFASAEFARKVLLEEISEFITYGLTVRPQYVKQGFPMISAGECKNGFIDFEKAKKISQSDFSQVRGKTIPAKGDLLITKTGTLGRVAVVQANAPEFTITQNVALIRPKYREVLPEYLAYYLMSPGCQREIKDKTSALAIPDLQLGILGNFCIPLHSIDDQKKISLLLASVANKIEVLEKRVTAYDLLKKSLAQDLLSGSKRVSV